MEIKKNKEVLERALKENLKLKYLLKDIPNLKKEVEDLNNLYEVQLEEHADMRKEFRYEIDKAKNWGNK